MTYSHYKNDDQAKARRKVFGAWLKKRRETLELTQLDLANALGYQYYVTVSQIERGINRVPPEDWPKWAELLKLPPKVFAEYALRHYDPIAAEMILGRDDSELP